ncbi:MAG: hypothetical protein J4F39_18855 [Candidatus Latescibacteria bacterium]|nr:hypothetical protein [Candidatus Latescibacterota bacterium]
MGLTIVDGAKRLIERVVTVAHSDDSVEGAADGDAWDRAQAADIGGGLRCCRIKMLSEDESRKAIDALKKKWNMP